MIKLDYVLGFLFIVKSKERRKNGMCENCMYLEYDEATKEEVCSVAPIMDEDDFARMSYYQSKRCPYYKIGDEYTLVRKQN